MPRAGWSASPCLVKQQAGGDKLEPQSVHIWLPQREELQPALLLSMWSFTKPLSQKDRIYLLLTQTLCTEKLETFACIPEELISVNRITKEAKRLS